MSDADIIVLAAKHGATFKQQPDGEWQALAHRRGRPLPMVALCDPSQAEAARMYLSYFNHLPKGA